jgi:hypothetical protein
VKGRIRGARKSRRRGRGGEYRRGTPAAMSEEHASTASSLLERSLLMRTSFVTSALLASLTASSLVACGGSDGGSFADASGEDRTIAVAVATGELTKGFTQIAAFIGVAALESGSTCPRAVVTGTDLTVTGDCTDDDGGQLLGSFVIRGFGLGEDGPTGAGVEFRGFGFGGDDSLSIDGRVDVTSAADGKDQIDQDLTVSGTDDGDERSLTVTGRIVCGAENGDCAPAGAYTVDVDTIGVATVTGAWRAATDNPQGTITLTGKDTLTVDFAKRDAQGCFEATIDGKKADAICLDDSEDDGGLGDSLRSLAARAVR